MRRRRRRRGRRGRRGGGDRGEALEAGRCCALARVCPLADVSVHSVRYHLAMPSVLLPAIRVLPPTTMRASPPPPHHYRGWGCGRVRILPTPPSFLASISLPLAHSPRARTAPAQTPSSTLPRIPSPHRVRARSGSWGVVPHRRVR